jgi:major membrane immunogen (membrane-anchored lipoprotein)
MRIAMVLALVLVACGARAKTQTLGNGRFFINAEASSKFGNKGAVSEEFNRAALAACQRAGFATFVVENQSDNWDHGYEVSGYVRCEGQRQHR